MFKVVGSVVVLILMVIAGYFVDPNFKKQIDSALGKSAKTEAVSQSDRSVKSDIVVSSNKQDALARVLDSGKFTVSVQSPSKPFYFGEGSRAKGFNVDFLAMLSNSGEFKGKVNGITPITTSTYEDVPKQLLTNRSVDLAIDGLTFNDEDLNGVVYTIPYVKDFGYSLITPKGSPINSASDLAGGKLGVLKGDPDARAFAEQAFPGVKIVELSDQADADGKWIVGHIKSGAVDAVMYDYPFAVAEVEGTNLQFSIAKIKGSGIQYRIGVRKEDKELLAALNSAIRKVTESDEYAESLKKYFMSSSVAAARRVSSGEVSYMVAKGDTLSTIAQAQLGDKMKYADIQSRNNLANPNFISVGQKLIIPAK